MWWVFQGLGECRLVLLLDIVGKHDLHTHIVFLVHTIVLDQHLIEEAGQNRQPFIELISHADKNAVLVGFVKCDGLSEAHEDLVISSQNPCAWRDVDVVQGPSRHEPVAHAELTVGVAMVHDIAVVDGASLYEALLKPQAMIDQESSV